MAHSAYVPVSAVEAEAEARGIETFEQQPRPVNLRGPGQGFHSKMIPTGADAEI